MAIPARPSGWPPPRGRSDRNPPSFETWHSTLYNLGRTPLPEDASNPASKSRRATIIAAGFLLLALALVVIYTGSRAFFSPLALVVVAAIGLAALLFQIRLRRDPSVTVHVPVWLNVTGLIFALGAILADIFHWTASVMQVTALLAVLCFNVSGIMMVRAMRKPKG